MCIRVSGCCGCGSLESGATTIAIFGMILGTISFFSGLAKFHFGSMIMALVEIVVSFLLFHGAKVGNTAQLMLWMMLTMIKLLLALALGIFLIVLSFKVESDWEMVKDFLMSNKLQEMTTPEMKPHVASFAWTTGATIVVICAIYLHFWQVVYSLYRKIKETRPAHCRDDRLGIF